MAELTYFSVISRVDGSSGKRRITIHPKIEGGRRSTDVHQVNREHVKRSTDGRPTVGSNRPALFDDCLDLADQSGKFEQRHDGVMERRAVVEFNSVEGASLSPEAPDAPSEASP